MNMGIETCRQCGKVFMKRESPLCPDCARREEEVFIQVRDYLNEHRGATLVELCKALGAAEETVSRLIEQGRLVMTAGNGPKCESCGTVVPPGQHLCLRCRVELNDSLRLAADVLRTSLKDSSSDQGSKIPGAYYTRRDH